MSSNRAVSEAQNYGTELPCGTGATPLRFCPHQAPAGDARARESLLLKVPALSAAERYEREAGSAADSSAAARGQHALDMAV